MQDPAPPNLRNCQGSELTSKLAPDLRPIFGWKPVGQRPVHLNVRSKHPPEIAGHCSSSQPIPRQECGHASEPPLRRDLELEQKIFAALVALVSQGGTVLELPEDGRADERGASIPDEVQLQMLGEDSSFDSDAPRGRYYTPLLVDDPRPIVDQSDIVAAAEHARDLALQLLRVPDIVRIDRRYELASRNGDRGVARRCDAAVRLPDQPRTWLRRAKLLGDGRGPVSRPVVDDAHSCS